VRFGQRREVGINYRDAGDVDLELEQFAAPIGFGDRAAGRANHPVVDVADDSGSLGNIQKRAGGSSSPVSLRMRINRSLEVT
jgi:hypothetical protein